MRNQITITEQGLMIKPRGLGKLWALKGSLMVPWEHVTGVKMDSTAFNERKGIRMPGTSIPGHYYAGSFYRDGQRTFYNVKRSDEIIIITLINEKYSRLILGVTDGQSIIKHVRNHMKEQA
ncbi:MAG: hypothetical protein Q3978_01255 [Limosilactobacillus gorillae]|jgi:hypothetical protein|uniref:hypothetical protein n=1 Tax=Limosilactobacillus gorillae TaxID=1450649 RepID=UPI000A82BB6A|nr:hypothetical protein [Limosilactobacillus gorillae]MDO4855174.1 hypothetical protein [Limosilactobacillus gorillae]